MSRFATVPVLIALLLAMPPGQSSSSAAGEAEPSSHRLIDGFMQTVFGVEHDRGWWFSGANRVKKYTVPVRFYIYNRARRDRRAQATAFLRQLPRHIPALDSAMAASPAEANFHLFIVDRSDFVQTVRQDTGLSFSAASNADCLVHIWFGRHGISQSRAIIVSDRGERLFRRCLVEEVLQGLGPINDSPTLSESVFNDYSAHDRLTAFDRRLLQMLYHPAIKPGMAPRDVAKLLPAVLTDIKSSR